MSAAMTSSSGDYVDLVPANVGAHDLVAAHILDPLDAHRQALGPAQFHEFRAHTDLDLAALH